MKETNGGLSRAAPADADFILQPEDAEEARGSNTEALRRCLGVQKHFDMSSAETLDSSTNGSASEPRVRREAHTASQPYDSKREEGNLGLRALSPMT